MRNDLGSAPQCADAQSPRKPGFVMDLTVVAAVSFPNVPFWVIRESNGIRKHLRDA